MTKVTIIKKDITVSASAKVSKNTDTKTNNGKGNTGTNNGNGGTTPVVDTGGIINMTLVNKIKSLSIGKTIPANGQLQPLYLNIGDNGVPALFRANTDNDELLSYEGAHIIPGKTMPSFVKVDVATAAITHIITPFKDGDVL